MYATDPRAAAVRYILAAESKVIVDPHANKTVRECYGVTPQAVQQWFKDPKITRELETDNFADDTTAADMIELLMRRGGERFRLRQPHNRRRDGRE